MPFPCQGLGCGVLPRRPPRPWRWCPRPLPLPLSLPLLRPGLLLVERALDLPDDLLPADFADARLPLAARPELRDRAERNDDRPADERDDWDLAEATDTCRWFLEELRELLPRLACWRALSRLVVFSLCFGSRAGL